MIKKFLKYTLLFFAFFLIGTFSIYFFKVYYLKEPIIIDNYFSVNEKKLKSFLSDKIDVNENQILIDDVGFEINDFNNFLSIKISNIKLVNEINETILKSNKINFNLSLYDLIDGLTNNNHLLFKNTFVDKIELEFSNNQNFKIINSSLFNFLRKVDYNKTNFFKGLKINQFDFKFIDTFSILKSNLLFKCKNLNFDVLNNDENFLLKCFEEKTNSGVMIKSFNYDKNKISIDGYFDTFNINLLNFKGYLNDLNFKGKLNSYFKINFDTNLEIKKFDFKILENSTLINKVNGKSNQIKLAGPGSYNLEKKILYLKNLVINNYKLDGNIVNADSKLLSKLKISFDKNNFDHFDSYLYDIIKNLFFENKNFLNSDNKFLLKKLKSQILVSSIFNIKNQEFENISLSSKGYYSSFIIDQKIDDLLHVNTNLNGFYELKYKNNELDLNVTGKFEEVKIKFIKLDEIYNLSEVDYSINYNNNKLTIHKLNLINRGNRVMEVKSILLGNNQKFDFIDLKMNIFDIPAKYFTHFYSKKIKKDKLAFTIDSGNIVNSKIYIRNKINTHEIINENIEILDLKFKNLSLNNYSIKFKNLNLTKKNDQVFIGNSKLFIKKIPINTSFEVNKSGLIRAFGSINFNKDLKSLINQKTQFNIESSNLLKFETEGNLYNKNFDIKVRSTLQNSSIFHKVLNLNVNNIKKGFVDLDLVFRNGTLKKIKDLSINYNDNEFKSSFDFQKNNLLKISNIYSKNFKARSILIHKENNKLKIKIDGKLVDISHLANEIIKIKDKKLNHVDVKFDIVSNKIILNDKFSLSGNLTGTYKNKIFSSLAKGKIILGSNTLLDAGQLSILVENGKYLITGKGSLNSGKTKVKITSSFDGLPKVTFESKEAGKLLSALGFTKKIKSGEVKLKVNFLDKNLSKYQGYINAKKFRVIDAPKIVKSLSSLSFSGINSLFVGEGVGFEVGDAKFEKIRNELKFKKILINNQTLSIYLEGDYDLNSEIINFKGSIVPFKIVSKFISVVPAVGELLTGSNKKGVISGQFKLNGKVSDPEIDINILSFSPGILRQIFSKDWLKEVKD